jgi:serpin B
MSNAFATDLYLGLAASTTGNLFFSPIGIETALAMIYAGAAGNTAVQMAKALRFTLPPEKLNAAYAKLLRALNSEPSRPPSGLHAALARLLRTVNSPPLSTGAIDASGTPIKAYELAIVNALWGQKGYGFKPRFMKLLLHSYGAAINEVDFRTNSEQARQSINDWAARQTRDRIKDLVPEGALDVLTRLVVTNAVYFKSTWADKFPKYATRDAPFKPSADRSVRVPTMQLTHTFRYAENDGLQMLEMPYSGRALTMVILLPRRPDALGGVEKNLTAENLAKWATAAAALTVAVSVPGFKISREVMLSKELGRLGMMDAFDLDKANFSGMASAEKLPISEVIHKAFIAVDEDGTEAAAATTLDVTLGASEREKPNVVVFNADHPFIFLIRHNSTGEILFIGRLMNPEVE